MAPRVSQPLRGEISPSDTMSAANLHGFTGGLVTTAPEAARAADSRPSKNEGRIYNLDATISGK